MTAPPRTTRACLQTPPARGGIAVLALAGPDAAGILARVFRPRPSHAAAGPGVLQLGHLVDGPSILDEAIVTFTDADTAELNIHGGPRVTQAALELLHRHGAHIGPPQTCPSFPPAHPRWDNPTIGQEMLACLGNARSALVASTISQQWAAGLSELACSTPSPEALHAAADGLAVASALLEPRDVVLAGPPNAGKSTLVNALVGRPVSIVNELAGTTRDWVRELASLDGVPLWLTDTAGLWDAPDAIDAEAVRRARQCIGRAHLVVLLAPHHGPEIPAWLDPAKTLPVASRCDEKPSQRPGVLTISALSGQGLDTLRHAILARLGLEHLDPRRPMAFTPRQARLVRSAADALDLRHNALAAQRLDELLRGGGHLR